MSKKTDNMYRELYKFLGAQSIEDEATMQEKLAEFQEKYNANIRAGGDGRFLEEDEVDKAYILLERAEESDSITEARRLAKQAYRTSKECFDAIVFLAENAPNYLEALNTINRGLADEKRRLAKENLYTPDNIGHFYTMFESRPYMRGLMAKAHILLGLGRLRQTIETLEEVLRLNNSDNLGARYMLMALYTFLEDEKSALDLYKRYPEESFFMQFSLFALYYKLDAQVKADKYLKAAIKCNKYILEYFNHDMKMLKALIQHSDAYSPGSREEVAIYIQDYGFLVDSIFDGVKTYIREYRKREQSKDTSL